MSHPFGIHDTLETKTDKVTGVGPGTPSLSYLNHFPKWELIRDLLGGTGTMREGGQKWLPIEEKETWTQYLSRLNRTFLFEGYANAVERIVSKPFSRSVTIKGELPEQLKAIERDTDFEGTDLTAFAREWFETGIGYGMSHALVDYPSLSGGISLKAQRDFNIHPYFRLVHPLDLIGSKQNKDPFTHKPFLTQIRILETDILETENYGEKEVEIVLEWNADGTWMRWIKEGSEWKPLGDPGKHTYPNRVPMVTFYTGKTGFMTCKPPLMGVAWLNLAHWQSSSDQRNILRVSRFPILHETGVDDDKALKPIVLGPFNGVRSPDPDAKLNWVEHSGKAIGAGKQDLDDLKLEMEQMGLQPFVQPAVRSRTATEVVGLESRTMTVIQSWIRGMENALEKAYAIAGIWTKSKLPEDFKVDIFNDFGLSFKSEQDSRVLDAARDRKDISLETYLRELRRRQQISSELDIDEEVKRVRKEIQEDLRNKNGEEERRDTSNINSELSQSMGTV